MGQDDDDIPEDKPLETPEQAFPGALSPLWSVRSGLLHQHNADDLTREPAILAITERQNRLLRQIEEQQVRIEERRKETEDDALRLRDGRRVYVDGDRYRDEDERLLTGADEAEAARQNEYLPAASTWVQKQDIHRRAADAQRLKNKIEQNRRSGSATPQESAQRLDGYENEFADKVQERTPQPVTDYGSGDYVNALGDDTQISAVPAFTGAAAAVSREAIRKPGDEDTGSATAELKQEAIRAEGEAGNKKPPQPFGQGAPKLQV
jgi:hypothetical protein